MQSSSTDSVSPAPSSPLSSSSSSSSSSLSRFSSLNEYCKCSSTPSPIHNIIFIRHGETIANELGIIQGQLEIPQAVLNERGRMQAAQAGRCLASVQGLKESIVRIISSDLKRAKQTALIARSACFGTNRIPQSSDLVDNKNNDDGDDEDDDDHTKGHEKLRHPPHTTSDKIRERMYGDGQGVFRSDLSRWNGRPPNSESRAQMKDRARQFLHQLFTDVSHTDTSSTQVDDDSDDDDNHDNDDHDNGDIDHYDDDNKANTKLDRKLRPTTIVVSHGGFLRTLGDTLYDQSEGTERFSNTYMGVAHLYLDRHINFVQHKEDKQHTSSSSSFSSSFSSTASLRLAIHEDHCPFYHTDVVYKRKITLPTGETGYYVLRKGNWPFSPESLSLEHLA